MGNISQRFCYQPLNTVLVRNSLYILVSNAEVEILQNLVEILHLVEIAATSLSAINVNLCTADLIISRMIATIRSKSDSVLKNELNDALIGRIIERSCFFRYHFLFHEKKIRRP